VLQPQPAGHQHHAGGDTPAVRSTGAVEADRCDALDAFAQATKKTGAMRRRV
jgi:hypothetical protein